MTTAAKPPDPNQTQTETTKTLGDRFKSGVERPVVIFMVALHGLTPLLCWLFPSALGVGMLFALYLLTGLGITVGYHRRLTHQSFQAQGWVDHILAVLGLLAGEGPPIFWVAHHRKHHKHSDLPGDPHTPKDGFFWAHWLWIFPKQDKRRLGVLYRRWAPDLLGNEFYLLLERSYFYWHLALLVGLAALGYLVGGWYMAGSFVAYGFFLRMVVVLHITWMVNSVAHVWGYRNYETTDTSRNNPVVGILAHGEGWHNNHHHIQQAANHGQRWWEFDLSFLVINALAVLSLPLKWVGWGDRRPVSQLKVYSYADQKITTRFRN